MSGLDVTELRRLLAKTTGGASGEIEFQQSRLALTRLLYNNADALLDAAEAVAKVTALADGWDGLDPEKHADWDTLQAVVADLRAALVAPDNHNKETP